MTVQFSLLSDLHTEGKKNNKDDEALLAEHI